MGATRLDTAAAMLHACEPTEKIVDYLRKSGSDSKIRSATSSLKTKMSDSEIRLGDWQTFQNRGALATSPSAGVRGRVGPEIFWRICALKTHFPSKKCALKSPQKSCWKAPFAIGIHSRPGVQNGGSNAAQGSDQVQVDLYQSW